MKKLSSPEIRSAFLNYFEKNNHLKIKASSVIPKNDPTLLFINAGMAPLKKYFLGIDTPPSPRLCNVQPCIRTKDIDDVGDRHHLTSFEMLGSWSIGDYYKEKACELAINLLVNELGLNMKDLFVSVYSGNKELGIPADSESEKAWQKLGFKDERIVKLGDDDNFWSAGDTGPCGPCTEIFFDTGEQHGPTYDPSTPNSEFNTARYVEIWNAGVFMEYNKVSGGKLEKLKMRSVDTGSGLERMSMIINGHTSVYETDLLKPILDLVLSEFKVNEKTARMIADHLRTTSFILSEGITLSNEGQGYIPRRLLRKIVAALVSAHVEKINLVPIVMRVIEIMGDFYPNFVTGKAPLLHGVQTEVEEFRPIILSGIERIEKEISKLSNKIFPGEISCSLVTTYGIPFDVIKSYLDERKISIDMDAHEKAYKHHQDISRVVKKGSGFNADDEKLRVLLKGESATIFVGYQQNTLNGTYSSISKILLNDDAFNDKIVEGEFGYIITSETPFYGESGGQVGDFGIIESSNAIAKVVDTIKCQNIFLHKVEVLKGSFKVNDEVKLRVDIERRSAIEKNHSATHLLHAALHQIVGKHAVQKGSLVNEERLRFDFANNKALTSEELFEIEKIVNANIQKNIGADIQIQKHADAVKSGAMALFGENYGDEVRVVHFGGESVELCGGAHVEATGVIGSFVIVSEASIAKGVRRIEALTGMNAFNYLNERSRIVKNLTEILKVRPNDIETNVLELQKKIKDLKKEIDDIKEGSAKIGQERIIRINDKINLYFGISNDSVKALKAFGDNLINEKKHQIIVLVSTEDNSLRVSTWVSEEYTSKIQAGNLLKEILQPINGKGGGKANFAQGGGENSNGENLKKIISTVENTIPAKLNQNG